MLQACKGGSYGLDKHGFIMHGEAHSDDVYLMDQDSIHCAKKLRNSLLQPVRVMMWGECVAHRNAIGEILTYWREKRVHGLSEDDINVSDIQNFPAVQRLAFPKVRECLRKMERGEAPGQVQPYDCRGIILYLYVFGVIWKYFLV